MLVSAARYAKVRNVEEGRSHSANSVIRAVSGQAGILGLGAAAFYNTPESVQIRALLLLREREKLVKRCRDRDRPPGAHGGGGGLWIGLGVGRNADECGCLWVIPYDASREEREGVGLPSWKKAKR